VKTEFLKQNLDKLPGIDCKMIDTLAEAGEIYSYNHGYDKARLRKGEKQGHIKLPEFKSESNISSCLTVADPIIQKLAQNKEADIFATDVALSALMCSTKAQYAWDIEIKKFAGYIFIDKRDSDNILDWQTIAETAQPDF
jgi:translation initiation factor 3 subunit D